MNILVCDDDKEIAHAIEIYLRNEGYTVYKAYDGIGALSVVRSKPVHLILMDIMMPKMDGMQATMKIREEANIPIKIRGLRQNNGSQCRCGRLHNKTVQPAGARSAGKITTEAVYESGQHGCQIAGGNIPLGGAHNR